MDRPVHLASQQALLTGRSFFPALITAPFQAGLRAALDFAIVASVLAAAASWTRGRHVAATDAAPVPAAAVASTDTVPPGEASAAEPADAEA